MKGGKAPLGYTIVEVMVVLAISSFMFLIAAQFVNGKQGRTAFTQGSTDFANKIESVAGQVNDGQFTDINLGQCNVSAAGVSISSVGPTRAQGTNTSCVFLGKLFYFHIGAGASDVESYSLFNLTGAFKDPNPPHNPVTSITGAYPAVIPGLTTTQTTTQNLEVRQIRITDTSNISHNNYSFGFTQGLGAASDSAEENAATYRTGSQTISLVYAPSLTANNTTVDESQAATNAQSKVYNNLAPASKAELCLTDNTHWAQLTIDLQHSGLNVDVKNLGNGSASCW
jgi:prepilin-type N-terminal cleavage/methylation domain-containing protein